jgi:4-amino-4-deoxy-L-arabinose transferase-like glycosyltransferase
VSTHTDATELAGADGLDSELHPETAAPAASEPESAPSSTAWRDRATQLARPAGYFVLSRMGVLFAALVSKWIFPNLKIPGLLGGGWDGGWYVRIAQHGYPHHLVNEFNSGSRWAFFPAYPAAIRSIVAVTGLSYTHAAIVASAVFGLASALAVWLMVNEVFGAKIADRTVLFYVFFPAAYVLSMAYTEGLFVAASCLCIYSLARRWWILAGVLASVASLSRNIGFVLVLCVAVAAVPVIAREKDKVRPIVGLLIAPIGIIGWLIYSWHQVGTPLAFEKAQKFWGQSHFVWFKTPFESFSHMFSGFGAFKVAPDVLASFALLFMLSGLAFLAWAQLRKVPIPPSWWVFAVGATLGAMSAYWPSNILRYTLVLIPLMAAYAWRIRESWTGAVVGAMAVSQGALAIIIFVAAAHPQATLLSP